MLNQRQNQLERLRDRLKWFLFFRVVVASFFLGALALVYLGSGAERYTVSINLLLFAIAATYALTVLSAVFLLRVKRLQEFAYAQLACDVVFTTGVIFITGGADSPFGFLYSLVVINGAFLLSTPAAVVVASLSSIAYAALIIVLGSELVARPDYPFPPAPLDLQFSLRFATTNVTFFLIAFLASSLVRRLHQAERLLEQREAERDRLALLHEALARNIGSVVVTTDADGYITSLNDIAEELVRAPAADVIGKDVGAVFAALRHTTTGRLQFLQSSGSVQPTEFAYRNSNGAELTLRCSAVALQDTYKNPIGALYILQDITALRQLEERSWSAASDAVSEEQIVDDEAPGTDGLVGSSPAMCRVRELIDRLSKSDATLLITGESGTGKEIVARAVHARSARCDRPFVAVNCGAIPANLMESELFGHARGAFTGAIRARAGLFRAADGGTIFLDEIADLPLLLQVKLLRVLQERSFTPIGSDTRVTVDVRVIAAANRDLANEVQAGSFREDLFYRLNVLAVELPPLRERRQDIPTLTRRFLREFAELHNRQVQGLSVGACRRLNEHNYPGNVRELENIIEHAVALCDGETIHEAHLPEYVFRKSGGCDTAAAHVWTPPNPAPPPSALTAFENLDDNLATYEKAVLLRALAEAGGVKKRAAELLGINYRSFRHRLHKYGLSESSDSPKLS